MMTNKFEIYEYSMKSFYFYFASSLIWFVRIPKAICFELLFAGGYPAVSLRQELRGGCLESAIL